MTEKNMHPLIKLQPVFSKDISVPLKLNGFIIVG